jgi:hypothetical protein
MGNRYRSPDQDNIAKLKQEGKKQGEKTRREERDVQTIT